MPESGTIVEMYDIVLEKISSGARNTEEVKKDFVGVVKCNFGDIIKKIDGWWIV